MKKLLGVIGILALAAAMLPAQGHADIRGTFAFLTSQSGFSQGCETSAHRPDDGTGTMLTAFDGRLEPAWITFTARSLIPGKENSRAIYLHWNQQQSAYFAVIKEDPTANISYFDPAWSYDGKYLAYTEGQGTSTALYVQEFVVSDDFEAVYGPGAGADSPAGPPFLITNVGNPRHPNWHPTDYKLAFDAENAGSRDLYTTDVDVVNMTASAPVRITFDNVRAEEQPSWNVDGHRIVYTTNQFGPLVLQILDTALPSGDPGYIRPAELQFAFIAHNNPDWDPNGNSVWYDAPGSENPNRPVSIWKLDVDTQVKCEIQLDERADADPDASPFIQTTRAPENIPFSYFTFTTQAGGFGVQVWRGNPVNSCLTPLPMGIAITPPTLNYKSNNSNPIITEMRFPPETKSHGYVCRSGNTGGEGVRLRSNIFNSPTLVQLPCPTNPDLTGGLFGVSNTQCFDTVDTTSVSPLVTERTITCYFDRRTVIEQLNVLGLTNQTVPLEMTAYSNLTGRKFQGFGYIKVTKSSSASSNVNLISNSPNPFNPVTKIAFAVEKAGTYTLRIYNVQGALVKTLASQRYDVGTHEATWDGRTSVGGKAASGVYYAKISGSDGEASTLRLVMAK